MSAAPADNVPTPLQRADTAKTLHPPGAWHDGPDDSSNTNVTESLQAPMAAVGNTLSGALSAAGNMAATYLPTSVVNSMASYAPGYVPQPKDAQGDTSSTQGGPKSDPLFNSSSATAPPSSRTDQSTTLPSDFSDPALNKGSTSDYNTSKLATSSDFSGAALSHDTKTSQAAGETLPDIGNLSIGKSGSVDNASGTGFASPSAITPAAAGILPNVTNVGGGNPQSHALTSSSGPGVLSSTGNVSGDQSKHDTSRNYGGSNPLLNELPSPSVIPPGPATHPNISSVTGDQPKHDVRSTTAVSGHSPTSATAASTHGSSLAPSRDASLPTTASYGDSPYGGEGPHAPSSTLSMKSGVIGSGPSQDRDNKTLPTIPSSTGATPGASELEKDDLKYLAPAISEQQSSHAVPTTAAASKPLESKPAGSTASHEKSSSSHATAPSVTTSGHSRNASASSSGELSPGGSKRKVGFAAKIKGEAKILKGKLTKDEAKVQEGRSIISGDH